MVSHKPILVTGSPRAGTSWAGRMLSEAPFVRYIHEPFNITGRPCRCGIQFKYWFHYLSSHNRVFFESHLKHTIFPSFSRIALNNLFTEIIKTHRIQPVLRYLQSYVFYRALVKDPLALFSVETLADLFDMNIVVLIRHPAAVVNSYKALNWPHPFLHFLDQAELMEEHLFPFRNEIEDFVKNDHDIVDQISLLWKLIHYVILKFQATHSDWVFIRYEDLALDPIETYRTIFQRIDLPFSKRVQTVIHAHRLQNQRSDITRPYTIKQDPYHVASKWKKSLTFEEISRIQRRVDAISSAFYSEQEWTR